MTHNILPTARPARTVQPTRTAVQLALKDELRTFGFTCSAARTGCCRMSAAAWSGRPSRATRPGTLHKLHHLIDSTAQATFSTLQVAQQAAAVAALPDAYRTLHFELQPMADFFLQHSDPKNPSQHFTNAFTGCSATRWRASPEAR